MNKKFFSAKNVALLGILIALVVVMQIFASAIPIFGITINLALIPIALASIFLGWFGGTVVGFVCGLVTFLTTAVFAAEGLTVVQFQSNPAVLTLTCILKTTIAGLVAGFVFDLLKKKNLYLGAIFSAFLIPIINTGIYVLGTMLMVEEVATFFGLEQSLNVVMTFVLSVIWLNFVLEVAITAIFTPVIHRVTRIFIKDDTKVASEIVEQEEIEQTEETDTEEK
ncbi:MAG: ECF transporter S component [Clostridiales bacterium]|nr:ECF transporter S component [Clostridiales bacterium]